jgi:nitrate reductase NapAB chaperone NapD
MVKHTKDISTVISSAPRICTTIVLVQKRRATAIYENASSITHSAITADSNELGRILIGIRSSEAMVKSVDEYRLFRLHI